MNRWLSQLPRNSQHLISSSLVHWLQAKMESELSDVINGGEPLIDLFNPNSKLRIDIGPFSFLLSSSSSSKRQRNSQERSLIWFLSWPPLLLAGLNWLPNLVLYIITIYTQLCIANQELEKNRKLCIADQSRAKGGGAMSEGGGDRYRLNDGGAMSWFGVAMVAVVIAIAVAIAFLFLLHLYSKWYLRRHRTSRSNRDINNPAAGGLDASILRSLPVVSFKVGDYKDGMECSVCLCEVSEGEKARLLPNCNHGFHLECIDMWFRSHSTCPLCRSTVSPAPVSGHAPPESTMDIPTNVLFWGSGSDNQVNAGRARAEDGSTSPSTSSTSSSTTSSSSPAAGAGEGDAGRKIVIDVARQNGVAAEESPRSPAARLRSFRKLFNREGRSMGWSTREEGEGDVEQGMAKL